MTKHGKKYTAAAAKVDAEKVYGAVEGVTERVNYFLDYARRLGVIDPGTAQSNGC